MKRYEGIALPAEGENEYNWNHGDIVFGHHPKPQKKREPVTPRATSQRDSKRDYHRKYG